MSAEGMVAQDFLGFLQRLFGQLPRSRYHLGEKEKEKEIETTIVQPPNVYDERLQCQASLSIDNFIRCRSWLI